MKDLEYDFFISHASEDKDSFVRPLVEKLIEKGYKVWYDEMSLNVGDSLIKNISNGIKKSLYGVLVLSPNFLKKKWPAKEFEALINKEIITEENLILPIWLNLTIQEVYDFSPLLVDKLAITIKPSEIDIAIKHLEKRFTIEHTTCKMILQKINFLIECNDDRRNKYLLDLEKRIKSIFLYQKEYYNWYTSDETFNDTRPWDDLLDAKKDTELRVEYGIPDGVWLNPEPFPSKHIDRAIKLCTKWVFRKMTYKDAQELYFLLEEMLDTDIHYILYGYPHSSIRDEDTYEKSLDGIFEVGIKNSENRIADEKKYNTAIESIFSKFYGR